MVMSETLPKPRIPNPRYQCKGTTPHAPPVCRTVHFEDKYAGYREPTELRHMMVESFSDDWTGFFCEPCIKAIEENMNTCSQCDASHLNYQTQVYDHTLAVDLEYQAVAMG